MIGMKLLLCLVFALSSALARDVAPGPAFRNAQEARAGKDQRRLEVFRKLIEFPQAAAPLPPKVGMQDFFSTALPRLALGVDVESVNKAILDPSFVAWNIGTEIALLGKVCQRMGDYDFILMGLLHIAYLDREKNLLSPEARHKLRHELLSQTGINHYSGFFLKNCFPVKKKDTENHILMTETARYLTNQLLLEESNDPKFDNAKNGFEEWFLNHLSQFLRHDFDELNSRPYQGYTIIQLATLMSFAEGKRVKVLSQMILDYLSAKNALQTIGLRRHSPFRRRKEYREPKVLTAADSAISWYSFHTGAHSYIDIASDEQRESAFEIYLYVMAAMDKYEIPEEIHNLFFTQKPLFQRLNFRDPEIYFRSENFLLTAGGRHRSVFGFFTGENDVWGVSTNIIGRSEGLSLDDLFQLRGSDNWNKRNNLCVAPNFACGTNFRAPKGVTPVIVGPWSFYETKDFQLAVFQDKDRALWEVREKGDFKSFQDEVLRRNATPFGKGKNEYVTVDGHKIVFDWGRKSPGESQILSYDGKSYPEDARDWTAAEGDVIESKGDGLVRLHLANGKVLELDDRDVLNPIRKLTDK